MAELKRTSFNVDKEVMKDITIMAAELETTQGKLVERYLREGIERDKANRNWIYTNIAIKEVNRNIAINKSNYAYLK